jgi:acetate kinase
MLDAQANTATERGERRVSADGARLHAFVIPTDEETQIARDTAHALSR